MPEVIALLGARLRGSVLVAHAAWSGAPSWTVPWRHCASGCRTAWWTRPRWPHCDLWHEEDAREINLELLARRLAMPTFTPHHALGDAMTTAVLLLVLATRREAERGRLRTRDLVELSRRGGRAR